MLISPVVLSPNRLSFSSWVYWSAANSILFTLLRNEFMWFQESELPTVFLFPQGAELRLHLIQAWFDPHDHVSYHVERGWNVSRVYIIVWLTLDCGDWRRWCFVTEASMDLIFTAQWVCVHCRDITLAPGRHCMSGTLMDAQSSLSCCRHWCCLPGPSRLAFLYRLSASYVGLHYKSFVYGFSFLLFFCIFI